MDAPRSHRSSLYGPSPVVGRPERQVDERPHFARLVGALEDVAWERLEGPAERGRERVKALPLERYSLRIGRGDILDLRDRRVAGLPQRRVAVDVEGKAKSSAVNGCPSCQARFGRRPPGDRHSAVGSDPPGVRVEPGQLRREDLRMSLFLPSAMSGN